MAIRDPAASAPLLPDEEPSPQDKLGADRSRSFEVSQSIGLALGRRLLLGLGTIVAVSILVFAAVEIIPVDPAMHALGRDSTPEQREAFRERMNLNDPPVTRYLHWAGQMARGEFGTSVISGRPVAPTLINRLQYTILLGLTALITSVSIGLLLAIWAARRRGSALDLALTTSAIALTSMPEFVLALGVLLIGASKLGLFPVTSTGITDGNLSALVLPTITLTLVAGAYVFRLARVSIIETLAAPYVRTAILNGFSPRRIIWRHVLPNAGGVIVNVVALNAIFLLSGVIVIENVFAYPGIGTLLVQAIKSGDLPMIEAVAVVTAVMLVAINLIADGVVVLIEPRLRTRAGTG
jgi:peptide/nickel transport system permease protein